MFKYKVDILLAALLSFTLLMLDNIGKLFWIVQKVLFPEFTPLFVWYLSLFGKITWY